MCMQDIKWGLHYILQWLNPNTFKLTTCAYDMELSMTIREDQRSSVYGSYGGENLELL